MGWRVTPQVKPHRVILRYPVADPKGVEARRWAVEHAGKEEMDGGDWHMTAFADLVQFTHIYRFVDINTALLFKLTWGGR